MEFDTATTAAIFLVIIAVATGGLVAAPFMAPGTVLMMVLPTMILFGLICLALGVKYGEHRTRSTA